MAWLDWAITSINPPVPPPLLIRGHACRPPFSLPEHGSGKLGTGKLLDIVLKNVARGWGCVIVVFMFYKQVK